MELPQPETANNPKKRTEMDRNSLYQIRVRRGDHQQASNTPELVARSHDNGIQIFSEIPNQRKRSTFLNGLNNICCR